MPTNLTCVILLQINAETRPFVNPAIDLYPATKGGKLCFDKIESHSLSFCVKMKSLIEIKKVFLVLFNVNTQSIVFKRN